MKKKPPIEVKEYEIVTEFVARYRLVVSASNEAEAKKNALDNNWVLDKTNISRTTTITSIKEKI